MFIGLGFKSRSEDMEYGWGNSGVLGGLGFSGGSSGFNRGFESGR